MEFYEIFPAVVTLSNARLEESFPFSTRGVSYYPPVLRRGGSNLKREKGSVFETHRPLQGRKAREGIKLVIVRDWDKIDPTTTRKVSD